MTKTRPSYDALKEIPFGTRPKVLLVGNGVNLSFPDATKIKGIVKKQWGMNHHEELNDDSPVMKMPFPLQIVVASKDNVQACMDDVIGNMRNRKPDRSQTKFLKGFLDIGFDAILTTNYSLEFELATIKDCTSQKIYMNYKTMRRQTSQQKQFGVFQCTELPYGNRPNLWHIHGTALRRNSPVIGQMYYGKLMQEVIARANEVNRGYRQTNKLELPFSPVSWIDYFLIGDIYSVGFSLDFAESDIWWLLSFKKLAFPESKVTLFEPELSEEKKLLLKCYNVETPRVEMLNKNDGEKDFMVYYENCRKKMETYVQKGERK